MLQEKYPTPTSAIRTKSRTERTLYGLPDKTTSKCPTKLRFSHSANNPPPPPEDDFNRWHNNDNNDNFNLEVAKIYEAGFYGATLFILVNPTIDRDYPLMNAVFYFGFTMASFATTASLRSVLFPKKNT